MGNLGIPIFAVSWIVIVNVVLYLMNENSLLKLYIEHGGTLAVTNRAKYVQEQAKPKKFLAWDILDPSHLVTGYWSNAWILLIYRIFALLYFAFTILYQGTEGSGIAPGFLIYFTNWTFILLGIYALLGIGVCVKALFPTSMLPRHKYDAQTEVPWGFLEQSFTLVLGTTCSNGIFLTVFYWVVLYDDGHVELDNPLKHGGNVVLLLIEIMLSKFPVVSYHFQISMLYGTIYVLFMWIYFGISGDWAYDTLDWSEGSSGGYYFILPILAGAGFYLMFAVAALREFLATGKNACICNCCSCCGDCCKPKATLCAERDDIEFAKL